MNAQLENGALNGSDIQHLFCTLVHTIEDEDYSKFSSSAPCRKSLRLQQLYTNKRLSWYYNIDKFKITIVVEKLQIPATTIFRFKIT